MSGIVSFKDLGTSGRAANQFFQLAALISYANKQGKSWKIPTWEYAKYFKNIDVSGFDDNIVLDTIYNEPTFTYSEIPPYNGVDVNLSGYFQSPKFHSNVNVRLLFELNTEFRGHVDVLYHRIGQLFPQGLRCCSIHVRRGDYLKEPHLSYHGILPIEYYDDACYKLYPKTLEDTLFIICSDDIGWCRENFKNERANIYFSEGENEIVDLFLMSKCNDHIIANSSYSWWSAYLNESPNKRVVCPVNWFKGAGLDTSDLIPKEWIRI